MARFIILTTYDAGGNESPVRVNADNILYYMKNGSGGNAKTEVIFGTVSLPVKESCNDLDGKMLAMRMAERK